MFLLVSGHVGMLQLLQYNICTAAKFRKPGAPDPSTGHGLLKQALAGVVGRLTPENVEAVVAAWLSTSPGCVMLQACDAAIVKPSASTTIL
jgi:hypothetical protein